MYIPPDEMEYFSFMFLVVGYGLLLVSVAFIIYLIVNLYGWFRRRIYGNNRTTRK